MNEHITTPTLSETVPVTPSAPAADGSVAGSEADVSVEAKDFLKEILGKDFLTNEAAIKSLQDTYSYVGSMGQKVKTLETQLTEAQKATVTPEVLSKIESLEKAIADSGFYAANPEYNTTEAKILIQKFGGKPEDVVKDDIFVKTFNALKTTAEMEQSKSVLHTNPRLGVAQDSMTKAREALKAGNDVDAAANAVAGVMDAFGMK